MSLAASNVKLGSWCLIAFSIEARACLLRAQMAGVLLWNHQAFLDMMKVPE